MGRARWLQVGLVGFLAGVVVSTYYDINPDVIIWLSVISIIVSVGLSKYRFAKTALFLLLTGASIGFFRGTIYNQTFKIPQPWLVQFVKLRSQTIDRLIGLSPQPEGNLAASIVLGGQGVLPSELKQPMIRTGTIHMAAVSGANLTIIIHVAAVTLPFLFGRWLGFSVGTLAVILFMGLTGFQPSIIRAGILGWLFLLARVTHRLINPVHVSLLVASIMIVFEPKIITQIGFQLSFASYLGLVLFEQPINDYLAKTIVRYITFFKDTIAATLAAQILSIPLILYYFNRLSVVAIPANVTISAIVTIMMFLGMLAIGVAWLPVIGQWIGLGLAPFAWAISRIVTWFDNLPLASIQTPPLNVYLLVIYYLVIGFITFNRSINRLNIRFKQKS